MKHFKNIQNLNEYYGINLKHPLIDIRKYEDIKSELIFTANRGRKNSNRKLIGIVLE